MLSTPTDGWTYFRLGEETYRLSYLTDVAAEWLTQAIHGLKTMDVFSVHGFSEPGRVICTVSFWSCYIIFENDGPAPDCDGVDHIHVNMMDFCKKLYQDIDSNLEGWVHWNDEFLECAVDNSLPEELEDADAEKLTSAGMEDAIRNREKSLRDMLGELKKLIDENEEYFDNGCFF